jgi:hypothetical protein
MSDVEGTMRHSLHPAKDGWKPIRPQRSHRSLFHPLVEVSGAGVEAQFLATAGLLLLGEDDLLMSQWLCYLERLHDVTGDLARGLWDALCSLGTRVPVPQAGPLPEGGFQFVWDRGEHHLEVDILPDRSFEWFYRNRRTGDVAGDDSAAGALPEVVRAQLAFFE